MNYDDLSDWARRAAIDLQSYATAAQEAGTPRERISLSRPARNTDERAQRDEDRARRRPAG